MQHSTAGSVIAATHRREMRGPAHPAASTAGCTASSTALAGLRRAGTAARFLLLPARVQTSQVAASVSTGTAGQALTPGTETASGFGATTLRRNSIPKARTGASPSCPALPTPTLKQERIFTPHPRGGSWAPHDPPRAASGRPCSTPPLQTKGARAGCGSTAPLTPPGLRPHAVLPARPRGAARFRPPLGAPSRGAPRRAGGASPRCRFPAARCPPCRGAGSGLPREPRPALGFGGSAARCCTAGCAESAQGFARR